ncbi:MAG: hypothetical protein HC875_31115, partial [Anaerolineales bacterium]|nr:hypothetical protein [Anaerolineales bacterium]
RRSRPGSGRFSGRRYQRRLCPPVDADIRQAQAYGLQGVPATIIAQKYLISGAQPLEALQDIVQQIKQRGE